MLPPSPAEAVSREIIPLQQQSANAPRNQQSLRSGMVRNLAATGHSHSTGAAQAQTGAAGPTVNGELTEADAIRLAQRGDAMAFERLYRLHCRTVYSLCRRMVHSPEEAEDLAQEAFLRLFRKIHTFRGESAFSTWLHRLTVNVVLMRLRRKHLVETSLDEPGEQGGEGVGPAREVGARDLNITGLVDRMSLERALRRLAPGFRIVFLLHDVQGYEHKEIAGMLGCSFSTSKSQLCKARARLRKLLQEEARERAGEEGEMPGREMALPPAASAP